MSRTEPENSIFRIITRAICLSMLFLSSQHALAQTADEWVVKGKAAYTSQSFDEASKSFEAAIARDPKNVDAHFWLAHTFDAQSHKLTADDAAALSARAHDEYLKVIALDPTNRGALAWLSNQSIKPTWQTKDPAERAKLIAEAVAWNQRWLQSGTPEATAYMNLGFLDHLQASTTPDLAIIDDGIKNLNAALALKPDLLTAMDFLAKLYTLRSPLETGSMASAHDLKLADDWTKKKADTKASLAPGANGPVKVASVKLLRQVQPEYPDLARHAHISGSVKFLTTIGKDGRVEKLELISGHQLLIDAATAAVKQWAWEPVKVNGDPVQVITTITVNFQLREKER